MTHVGKSSQNKENTMRDTRKLLLVSITGRLTWWLAAAARGG